MDIISSQTVNKMLIRYHEAQIKDISHLGEITEVSEDEGSEWSQLRSCLQKMEHAVHRLASEEILSRTEYFKSPNAVTDAPMTTLDLDAATSGQTDCITIGKLKIKRLDFSAFIPGFRPSPTAANTTAEPPPPKRFLNSFSLP